MRCGWMGSVRWDGFEIEKMQVWSGMESSTLVRAIWGAGWLGKESDEMGRMGCKAEIDT